MGCGGLFFCCLIPMALQDESSLRNSIALSNESNKLQYSLDALDIRYKSCPQEQAERSNKAVAQRSELF